MDSICSPTLKRMILDEGESTFYRGIDQEGFLQAIALPRTIRQPGAC